MTDDHGPTLADLLRVAPTRTLILIVVPVALAFAQLLNGYYTNLPMWAAGGFAAVLLATTGLLARYHLAELRVLRIETDLDARGAD